MVSAFPSSFPAGDRGVRIGGGRVPEYAAGEALCSAGRWRQVAAAKVTAGSWNWVLVGLWERQE